MEWNITPKRPKLFLIPRRISAHEMSSLAPPEASTCLSYSCNLSRAGAPKPRAAHINEMIMEFIITHTPAHTHIHTHAAMLVPLCIVKCVNTFASRRQWQWQRSQRSGGRRRRRRRQTAQRSAASLSHTRGPHGAYAISNALAAQIFDAYRA